MFVSEGSFGIFLPEEHCQAEILEGSVICIDIPLGLTCNVTGLLAIVAPAGGQALAASV